MLTAWTSDPAVARAADEAGVERVGVDLERVGKAERQHGLATWISPHEEGDLLRVGSVLTRAALFARVNPLRADSRREVEAVVAAGARVVMLPMVATAEDAATFVGLVAGRAHVVLLIEQREALDRLPEIVAVDGVDEVHIGLNDLALSLRLPNRWLLLADDRMVEIGAMVRGAGLRFGLGGVGRAGDDHLPIPTDLVYAEYARTGATAALLSRSFHTGDPADLRQDIRRLRERIADWFARSPHDLAVAHAELARRARQAAGW